MSDEADRKPQLSSVINGAVERAIRDCHRMLPAKVVKWDSSKGRADCQILIRNVYEDEDGERQAVSWPVVPGVPVAFVGAGKFRITCPISDGSDGGEQTMGMLQWSHRSLDKWLTGDGKEVDPEFDHDGALGDAVFVPGLRPFGSPWTNGASDAMTIGSDSDANGRIKCKESEIQLGDGATKEVARKGDAISNGTIALAVTGTTSVVLTYTPGDGGPQQVVTNSGTLTLGEKVNAGSGHVKAVD